MKIEKFFSLIKSYREARNRLIMIRKHQMPISSHDHHGYNDANDDHESTLEEMEMEMEIEMKKKKKKRMRSSTTSTPVAEQCQSRCDFSSNTKEELDHDDGKVQIDHQFIKKLGETPPDHHNKATKLDNINGLDLNLAL
ncbi:NIM1-interacting protein [Parasponia andersonii]|uniref:NIM1-interacting protein n=1 Tax=Parasponia andersonii TaxID=3476 RepID=A0A2P5CL62_PARAD|nr:NIM1-interacting protein [Parasponia andersonii]